MLSIPEIDQQDLSFRQPRKHCPPAQCKAIDSCGIAQKTAKIPSPRPLLPRAHSGGIYMYRARGIRTTMRLIVIFCMVGLLALATACADQQPEAPAPTPAVTTPVPGTPAETETDPAATPPETGEEAGATPVAPSAWAADGTITEGEYESSQEVGPGYTVHWNNDAERLTMALQAEAEGWVSVGFEPTSGMNEADIVLGWVEGTQVTVQDQFSIGPTGPHPPDAELGGTNDLLEVGGSEQDGTTVIEFSRRLDTGDAYDKALSPGQTVDIIWALSSVDDPNPQHDVGRGSAQITLGAA